MKTRISRSTTEPSQQRSRIHTTLLDLVWAVSQVVEDDRLVAATVAHMVNNGQARLVGTFKEARIIVV